jgi:catechol 2,3-dioxygenase-like lactoylglutathione lyase family enzyme
MHSERVLGHLGINVPDLAAARSYYGAIMPLLDFELFADADDQIAFMPASGKRGTYLFFYPSSAPVPYSRLNAGLQHLAFVVPTRQRVRDVYEAALALGGREVHAPQNWPQYPPPYFAGFWLDPFGVMLEAVCHHDR